MAVTTKAPRQSAQAMADRLLRTLALNARSAREEMGLTQRELAAKAGTSQRRINMIETAIANPTLLTLVRVGKCVNRTVVELLTAPTQPPSKP